jgi:mRNA-degrading endonuclease YafQ of YafQ-DinJ toxin-antitoxin module
MTIYYTARFRRNFKNLDRPLKSTAGKKIELFRQNPFDSRLHTHSLHGRLKELSSFSVNARFRILFEFIDAGRDQVIFLDIGDHSLYR